MPNSGDRHDPSVVVTARIPQSVRDALAVKAEEKGQKLSVFLRELLAGAVRPPEKEPRPPPTPTPTTTLPARDQTHPGLQATLPLLDDESADVGWRVSLFVAHQNAVEAGHAVGCMVALDVLAQRLGWIVAVVRHRVQRARRERWAAISHPIYGVDDIERANVTTPPTGRELQHAVAAADLSEWIGENPDGVSRLGIRATRMQTLLERRATPARWERQRLEFVANIPGDTWAPTSPGTWTRERAVVALRAALPDDDVIRAKIAHRCRTRPESLEHWANGIAVPPQRDLLELEFGIPAHAWGT